jgi:mono/diheme cytochrome c family protein
VRRITFAALALVVAGGCGDSFDLDAGDRVGLGLAYVQKRDCQSCHGNDLSGSTMARPMSQAYAANLTPDRLTGLGEWADVEIVRALRAGVDNQGQQLCPTMPIYADMSDVEAWSIVAYLRSVPPVSRPDLPPSMCPPIKPPPARDLSVPDLPPPDLSVGGDDLSNPVDGGGSD